MKRLKDGMFGVLSVFLTLILTGCAQWWATVFERPETVLIQDTIVWGQTVEFKPGTRIIFVEVAQPQLVLRDGAKIIAKGTPDKPIIFEAQKEARVLFMGSGNWEQSLIEYCKFGKDVDLEIEAPLPVRYCKFVGSTLWAEEGEVSFNTFQGACSRGRIIINGYGVRPKITYNQIKDGKRGIVFDSICQPEIRFNNIINTESYAVGKYYDIWVPSPTYHTIDHNYIADCNGQTGVDLDGGQSKCILYTNAQNSPIPGAGCGW